MDRRDISRAIIGVAAGSALLPRQVEAQTCTTGPCYPETYAETHANLTPPFAPNTAYPPGNLLRYGADNTGSKPSDNALAYAILFATTIPPSGMPPSASATIYAPAGLYTFATGVSAIPQPGGSTAALPSSFTLMGDGRGNSNSTRLPASPGGGTIFQLKSSNANAAFLTFTAEVQWIRIEKIQFLLTGTLGQYCLNFAQAVGDSLIDDCWFAETAAAPQAQAALASRFKLQLPALILITGMSTFVIVSLVTTTLELR